MILLSPLNLRTEIFDFRFLINHNHVTLCRWTLIFRFLRVVWPELSDENLKNNFPRFYKISVLSRFGAIETWWRWKSVLVTWQPLLYHHYSITWSNNLENSRAWSSNDRWWIYNLTRKTYSGFFFQIQLQIKFLDFSSILKIAKNLREVSKNTTFLINYLLVLIFML